MLKFKDSILNLTHFAKMLLAHKSLTTQKLSRNFVHKGVKSRILRKDSARDISCNVNRESLYRSISGRVLRFFL